MKRKKSQDITFIIIFVLCTSLSLAYLLQTSYAKYRKNINVETKFKIAEWNIILNNENINGKTTLSSAIQPTYYGNEYTDEGVIAPGMSGHADLIIDATNVDVDFNYNISLTIPEESILKDLIITNYQLNPSDSASVITPFDQSGNLVGTIARHTENTTIRLYITWNDNEDNIMDNEADTLAAADPTIDGIINANVSFTQKSN